MVKGPCHYSNDIALYKLLISQPPDKNFVHIYNKNFFSVCFLGIQTDFEVPFFARY